MINRRQLRFIRHIIRRENRENLCLGDRFHGKRARGRQRIIYSGNFQNIMQPRLLSDTARERSIVSRSSEGRIGYDKDDNNFELEQW